MYSKKIREAIKKGLLVSHEDVLKKYSKKERAGIVESAKYFKARAELRNLRSKMKLSQSQLAQKMNVKREFISRIESGDQNITLETLFRIARATGKEFKFTFE